MEIRFRSAAKRVYFAAHKNYEPQLVEVWDFLEEVRQGRRSCPCEVGRTAHGYIRCGNGDVIVLTYERPETGLLFIKTIRRI